ncbi:fungal-specific transcription factor domain-containing protein [Gloeopeniophorella convolvens]|nr:fungal-specific transcription factor domain-containing protein [Gloeopeniophorella convolvens]
MSDPSSSQRAISSAKPVRHKLSTSSEAPPSHIRPRSPSSGDAPLSTDPARQPAKRARKAINCGPCRLSKLKCDRRVPSRPRLVTFILPRLPALRERPCSSCKLRGTTAQCYQGQDGGVSPTARGDDPSNPRNVNPAIELSKIRQALNLIEAHVNYIQRGAPGSSSASTLPRGSSNGSVSLPPITSPYLSQPKAELAEPDMSDQDAAPGARGQADQSGFYAGPTSVASHLSSDVRDNNSTPDSQVTLTESALDRGGSDVDYDLRIELPHASVVDGLVEFYFEYCNWVYRHVNHRAFMTAWARYKSGAVADRIVLATVFMIMAVALHYLPADHDLLRALPPDIEELGTRFYNVMRLALQRRQAESRAYTLELVELLLIRCHYLTLSKIDSEEIWHVKGELVNIATAMGLHRDPGKQKMSLEVAERRRWAWWHVILLERWQAFMFGRPIAIASHHFDTDLPSYCDPEIDATGRLYDANLHLFRLAFILGDIMDDAVSLRPVPYESVLSKDQLLQEWWETLPSELDMDDYSLVGCLASPTTSKRRIGVQSVIVRTAFLHIRFTLHRPYASLAHGEGSKYIQSLETAVNAADKLIALSAHARPEMHNNAALSVPGHMNWGPLHCFSAAMFFCFQIINNPEQPGARLLRANVLRAVATLEYCRGMPIADKALDILRALGPLYTEAFLADAQETREQKKQAVLPAVRRLQFPYHDSSNVPIGAGESPRNGTLSPSHSSAHTGSPTPDAAQKHPAVSHGHPQPQLQSMAPPPAPIMQPHQHNMQLQHQQPGPQTYANLPSLKWPQATLVPHDMQYVPPQQSQPPLAQYPGAQPHQQQHVIWSSQPGQAQPMLPPDPGSHSGSLYGSQQMVQDPYMDTADGTPGMQIGFGGTESALWGATSGFVQGEWDRMYPGLGRGPPRGMPLEG